MRWTAWVLDADRVCVLEVGHIPPHEDADGVTWMAGDEVPLYEAFNRYANRPA